MKQLTFETDKARLLFWEKKDKSVIFKRSEAIKLPVGNWINFGFIQDLTEAQKESVVDEFELFGGISVGYKRYDFDEPVCDTASESFTSLCNHIGAYVENPFGVDYPNGIHLTQDKPYTLNWLREQWQTAQESVSNSWIVLAEYK